MAETQKLYGVHVRPLDSDPEIELVGAEPNGLSGDHRGPCNDARTLESAIGDSCSPSDVFNHIQNAGDLPDKHNDPIGHCPN